MAAEDKHNLCKTGESLLRPDAYDFPGLLDACNKGQLEVYDTEKQKWLIPVTQLKRIKRVYDTAIAFDIPMTTGPTYAIVGFRFQEPTDPVWKGLFSQNEGYWQSAIKSSEVNEWHFCIPDELGNYDKLINLQLREGEKYELPFEVTLNGSGPGLLYHPVQADTVQYTYPYYPDQDGVLGAFLYEPEQCAIQGAATFLSFQKNYSERMQIWFERLAETNDIDWYVQISTQKFRAYDPRCHHIDNINNQINDELAAYVCYETDSQSVSRLLKDRLHNSCSLNKSIQAVEDNCKIPFELRNSTYGKYVKTKVLLRELIMDTDHVYEHPAGLTKGKCEPFIFNTESFIKRYYIFNPKKGLDEFEKKVRSFLYRPVAEGATAHTSTMPHCPTCRSQCEKQGPITLNQTLIVNRYDISAPNSSGEDTVTKENSASPEPARPETSLPSLPKTFPPTIYPSQLEVPPKSINKESKAMIIEGVKERIERLRRRYLEKLIDSAGKITENEVYVELRQKGASRINAARVIYLEQGAMEAILRAGDYESRHLLMNKTGSKDIDTMLTVARDTVNNRVKKYEEKLQETFLKINLMAYSKKLEKEPTKTKAKKIKKALKNRLKERLLAAPLKSDHIDILVRETV